MGQKRALVNPCGSTDCSSFVWLAICPINAEITTLNTLLAGLNR